MLQLRTMARRMLAVLATIALATVPAAAQTETTAPPDATPPAGAPTSPIHAEGPQAGYGDLLVVGPGAHLVPPAATSLDAGEHLQLVLDGNAATAESWSAGWTPGRHQASGYVVRASGEEEPFPPLDFLVDLDQPVLHDEATDADVFEQHGLDQGVDEPRSPRRIHASRAVPLVWTSDGRRWLPVLGFGERSAAWTVESDRPQIFLWAKHDVTLGGDVPGLAEGHVLRVWAEDPTSAVQRLEVTARRTADGGEIVFQAIDLVGNQSTLTVPVARK